MVFAAMAAMPLVDQHNQIRARILAFGQLGGGRELVDDREDHALIAATNAIGQIPPTDRFGAIVVLRPGAKRAAV
jgi:hypothetical protein